MDNKAYNRQLKGLRMVARKKAKGKRGRSPNMTYRNRGRLAKFKSKFEAKIHEDLKSRGLDSNYESLKITYTQTRTYTPDFPLERKGKQIIIEAKGIFEPEDRRKHLDVQKQYPDYDIRFVFYKDYAIYKGSKTKYSQWCEKNNFKYAIGEVPVSWIEELGIKKEDQLEYKQEKQAKQKEGSIDGKNIKIPVKKRRSNRPGNSKRVIRSSK